MGYSKNIIQTNNGYVIKNYSVALLYLFYFLIVLLIMFLVLFTILIIFSIESKEIGKIFGLVIGIIIICFISFILFISTKKIIIENKEKKIIFKYGLLPFIKIKKLDIDKIKNISINYVKDAVSGSDQFKEMIYESVSAIIVGLFGSGSYQFSEKSYMVDLIDKDQYSYSIFKSEVYNEDLIDFANKIGNIIGKEVDDKNTVEGYRNIYKKNII
jgi:hypothetical protein